MFIVDTNIVSMTAPGRVGAPVEIVEWLRAHSGDLFISVVAVAEMQDGICKARRDGATAKATRLANWLELVLLSYEARILAITLDCAREAGRLTDLARGKGHAPGWADVMIAATAQHHGLTVVTRNVKHFAPLGVKVIDPFGVF